MPRRPAGTFETRTIDQLAIDDERSFAHVALYADLKAVLLRDGYAVRVLPRRWRGRWDRALLLNLTFWGGAGGDVLVDDHLPADVLAHAAWHHLAAGALGRSGAALFLGEAIASAFDVYLVGRLLGRAPRSSFLATQGAAMAEATEAAGLSGKGFQALLARLARNPERAFESLRELLFDATSALSRCPDATAALAALAAFDRHPFAPLLHRYELSNWVLYARAYAAGDAASVEAAGEVDRTLRSKGDAALSWLATAWVTPALGRVDSGA
jgi:hypothetical protein